MMSEQSNTYIKKMQHFWTVSNKVKERGWLNIGYNTQEVCEIQVGFEGVYCVFSGLHDTQHLQEFTINVARCFTLLVSSKIGEWQKWRVLQRYT
jgi:hypothetical protein